VQTMAPVLELNNALRACAAGDRSALRLIYDLGAARMLGVALRLLRRRALAEEVIQDAFLQIWEHAASFDPERGHARTWVYAIVRNRALNILRSESRTDLTQNIEDISGADPDDDPEQVVMRLSEASALRRCLSGLEPARRRIVVLAYIHGLSHGELAGRVGCPLGTLKSWLRRSLQSLRRCLA